MPGLSPCRLIQQPGSAFFINLHNSPACLRVRRWSRLQKIGAVPVKNVAYGLPNSEQSLEDLHWLAREIMEKGGRRFGVRGDLYRGSYESRRDTAVSRGSRSRLPTGPGRSSRS